MWVRRYTNTTISMGSVHMLHTLKWHQQNQQARQLSLSCALVIKQQYNRDRTIANGFRSLIEMDCLVIGKTHDETFTLGLSPL